MPIRGLKLNPDSLVLKKLESKPLVFYTIDSISSIDYLCANDKNVITGLQSVFESKKTNAPSELGSIIGNYLTGKPIPQLPE